MIPIIGDNVILDKTKLVHVQDRNCLEQTAKVGVPDNNDIVWETEWIEWERLTKDEKNHGQNHTP